MVQIIENWSDIKGTVLSIQPADLGGFSTVGLKVEEERPVEGFADLMKDYTGKDISLSVPTALLKKEGIGVGDVIACRARRGGKSSIFVNDEYFSKVK